MSLNHTLTLTRDSVLNEWRVVIEAITNYRDEQPSMEAIYLLMPTSQNIDRIIRDFSNGRRQYAGVHLFFIDGAYVHASVR